MRRVGPVFPTGSVPAARHDPRGIPPAGTPEGDLLRQKVAVGESTGPAKVSPKAANGMI